MTFPTNVKLTNAVVPPQLQAILEQKLVTLEKYIGDETDVVCEVEFEKVAPKENGPVHRLEINLYVAGTLYRAEATANSFEMAIDEVRDELDKEMRRNKSKRLTLLKKGGRKIKEEVLKASS